MQEGCQCLRQQGLELTLLGVCQYPCSLLTPAPATTAAAGRRFAGALHQLLQLLLVAEQLVAAEQAGQQIQAEWGDVAAAAAVDAGGFARLLGWRFASFPGSGFGAAAAAAVRGEDGEAGAIQQLQQCRRKGKQCV